MRYAITLEQPKRYGLLVMTCDEEEQAALLAAQEEDPDRFDTDDFMVDLFEPMVCNDCFSWLPEGVTSDLTSAPMLAVLGCEERAKRRYKNNHRMLDGSGLYPCGFDGRQQIVQPVLYRYAYMDYAVCTPQRDLLNHGRAVWTGGEYILRHGQMGFCYLEREAGLRIL